MKRLLFCLGLLSLLFVPRIAWGITVSDASGSPGQTDIPVTITVQNDQNNITAVDLWLTYDTNALQVAGAQAGNLTTGWNVVTNTSSPGLVKIAIYSTRALATGGGSIAVANFNVNATATSGSSRLHLTKAEFNETPAASITNGTFTVLQRPNQSPVLDPIGNKTVDAAKTLSFSISATDPDGGTLTYSASSLPTGASFNPNTHVFTWTPDYGQAGSYRVSFTVRNARDGTASETITITVNRVNQRPQITSGPTANPAIIDKNQTAQITVTATDPDQDNLTYIWSATGGTISGSGSTVTYNPPPDISIQTTYTISVTVDDNRGGSISGNVYITVRPVIVKRAPVPNSIGDKTVNERKNLNFPLPVSEKPVVPSTQEQKETDQTISGGVISYNIIPPEESPQEAGKKAQKETKEKSKPIDITEERPMQPLGYDYIPENILTPQHQKPVSIPIPLAGKASVLAQAYPHQETKETPSSIVQEEETKPILTLKKAKQFLFWKVYQLELKGEAKPIFWQLAKGEKLPGMLLKLNAKQGTIYGIMLKKTKVVLRLIVTTDDNQKIETKFTGIVD